MPLAIRKRFILIVLDGVGVGELPDASAFRDEGSNTLGNIDRQSGSLKLPTLQQLGLGNILSLKNVRALALPLGCYGKASELSKGKDSTSGHWEIGGIITEKPFPTYPDGFPSDLIEKFKAVTGCKGVLGNKPASGTVILQELGEEHLCTGYPIVYTSADSVFQIAAHEEVIPLQKLYEICQKTRDYVVTGEHAVARVIARPFVGSKGSFARTPNRRDFSLAPHSKTVLDFLMEKGIPTIGVGKIDDLFAGQGLSEKVHTKSNAEGIEHIVEWARKLDFGLVMANLVDFDMLYGHRNDVEGFVRALEYFDSQLPRIMEILSDEDLLLLTADHGNDPTTPSTDHSREYVPILCYSKSGKHGVNLGVRKSFADVGKTVTDFFGLDVPLAGESFLRMIF